MTIKQQIKDSIESLSEIMENDNYGINNHKYYELITKLVNIYEEVEHDPSGRIDFYTYLTNKYGIMNVENIKNMVEMTVT